MLVAAAIATALAGCARQQQHEAQAVPPQRPHPAYCRPSPAPDCAFKGARLNTVDPAEFARLKHAYERRCVRRAEKAERERMHELHDAGLCGDRPAPTLATSR